MPRQRMGKCRAKEAKKAKEDRNRILGAFAFFAAFARHFSVWITRLLAKKNGSRLVTGGIESG